MIVNSANWTGIGKTDKLSGETISVFDNGQFFPFVTAIFICLILYRIVVYIYPFQG